MERNIVFGPAEQQFVVLRISIGESVSQEEFEWAVEQGYVAVEPDDTVEVTDKGWNFLRPS